MSFSGRYTSNFELVLKNSTPKSHIPQFFNSLIMSNSFIYWLGITEHIFHLINKQKSIRI